MNADEIVRVLRSYSQSLVGYKLGCEFADAVEEAASLIEPLQAQLAEQQAANDTLRREVPRLAMESVERDMELAKLEAEVMVWAKAEQEGRLVVLPCKVGDTVYEITQDYYAVVDCPYVDSVYVDEIAYTVWDEDDEVQIKLNGYLDIEDLYYTRAEAEEALLKGESHD